MALLLFLFILWPMIINLSTCEGENIACVYDEDAAGQSERTCANKPCSIGSDVCKGNRQCMCDGACGYRCISIKSTSYCGELDRPGNGSVVYTSDDRVFGSRATYECDHRFLLSETTERTCLGDREWSNGVAPMCRPQDEVCPRLMDSSEGLVGSQSCYPACNSRSDCTPRKHHGCLCHGDCGMSCIPVYVPRYCPEVELSEGAVVLSITPRGRVFGSVATLGCEDTYEADSGNEKITCLIDKSWSAPLLTCRRRATCSRPLIVERAQHNSREVFFFPGDTLTYTCRVGYHYYGNGESSTCQDDLSWTPVDLSCFPISCGDPGYLRNGYREGNIFTFLSSITFHCNTGYAMSGFPYRTCTSTQQWSSFMPECIAIECPELYAPDHGTKDGSRNAYNSRVYFDCDRGYKLIGSEVRLCQGDKTWSGEETTCKVIECPMPEAPLHGSMIAPRLGLDAIVRFSCNEGYFLEGSRTARCTAEDVWSEQVPACQAHCTVPSQPPNGYYRFGNVRAGDVVEHGTVVQIKCYNHYSLSSREPYTCNSGEWSFDPQCLPDPCPKLAEPHNGVITYHPEVNQSMLTIPHDTQATYDCLHGFEQHGESYSTRCEFGEWQDVPVLVCQPQPCVHENLAFGEVRYTKDSEVFNIRDKDPHHGVVRTFKCSRGFTLTSWDDSTCDEGEWSSSPPTCRPDPCSRLTDTGGNIEYTNNNVSHGASALLTCGQGLKPSVGDGHIKCHAGHWVPDGVNCINNDAAFNVAYGKPTIQSKLHFESDGRPASLAVDGDRNTDYGHRGCATARKSGSRLFWQVDLLDTYKVEYVVIYRKINRLKQATVKVGLGGSSVDSRMQCGVAISKGMAEQEPIRVDCTPSVYGQLVSIQVEQTQTSKMTLCEVEVFATGPYASCSIPFIPHLKVTLEGQTEELPTNTKVLSETIVSYECEAGYQRNGPVANKCYGGDTWAYADPSCQAAGCAVGDPHSGRLDQRISDIEHGMYLAYSCNDGYEKLNEQTLCEFGELRPSEPQCVPRSCRVDEDELRNILINKEEPSLDARGNIVIPHNTNMYFSCRAGFSLQDVNNDNPLCWNGELMYFNSFPSCVAVQCPIPTAPSHGSFRLVEGDTYVHEATIRYKCYQGYTLRDARTEYSLCQVGVWSGETRPVCQKLAAVSVTEAPAENVECPTPSVPQAVIYYRETNIATVDFETIFINGYEIEARCTAGFKVNGQKAVTMTCRNGAWTPATPLCVAAFKRSCGRPGDIQGVAQYLNGRIKLDDTPLQEFLHGSTIVSRCRNPLEYKLQTTPERTCHYGTWRGPTPSCGTTYTKFTIPSIVSLIYQYFANGTMLIYPGVGKLIIDCNVPRGYRPNIIDSHVSTWVSAAKGRDYGIPNEALSGTFKCAWFGLPAFYHKLDIEVRAVSCPEPKAPLNGRRIGEDDAFRILSRISFACNEGYDIIGEQTIQCNLGTWLGEIPSCRARNCPILILEDRPNLNMTNEGNSPGATVAFLCQSGYRLIGELFLDCLDGRWSNSVPRCEVVAIAETNAPLECNCEIWQTCIMEDNNQQTCKCIHPQLCDEATGSEQYCGSDGQTYTSICKLKAAACLLDMDIEVDSHGPCPEKSEPDYQDPQDAGYSSYAYMYEGSSASSVDTGTSASSPATTEGRNVVAADAPQNATATATESGSSVDYCGHCITPDLRTACQQSTHIFVGRPKSVQETEQHYLTYSMDVINPVKGLNDAALHTDVTLVVQGFDEMNHCHCPSISINYDDYLFILRQGDDDDDDDDDNATLILKGGFVGLWGDYSDEFMESCFSDSSRV